MSRYSESFLNIVRSIESIIAAYYGGSLYAYAENFLCQEELKYGDRGCLFLRQSTDHLDLSIHFHQDIYDSLSNNNPLELLFEKNIDAFCVVIEEVSHFHMILNFQDHQLSWIDLELQAEIDKLLVCSLLLHQQQGSYHISALVHLLFDRASIPHSSSRAYHEANRLGAYFWYRAIEQGLGSQFTLFDPKFRRMMIKNYRSRSAERKTPLRQPVAL